ncbi:beta-lactamase regulating signal transducer with metallopeptidase domain [Paenibacillus rhizosphaerae]|uniref:Beta-lactamase regulating signal transducer with metallopeptidase domain n=1 Tax=Paenibacillus rhizosphaerae TaxID=297318 RepID=A0A839TPK2_9BACL|nr:M56 family metallopeptidase [Paenibacillus rhizosphaerae]MBB3128904.1 beta-lactamase regulating signal transducer with metallopeptidase domain [Paenibacillus rhizosphaerae]
MKLGDEADLFPGELAGSHEFGTSPPTQKDSGLSVRSILITVWLTGAALLLIRLVIANVRYTRLLGRHSQETDPGMVQMLGEAKARMGVRRSIGLKLSPAVSSPTLFGVIRPRMIMPPGMAELDEAQQKHIFLHELAHAKRWDILVNWVAQILLAFHWYNPLLWYAFYRMREDQELSADALALRRMDPNQIAQYGYTILTLLEQYRTDAYVPGTARLSASRRQLRRRILMIKSFKPASIRWTVIGLVLVLALGGCALTDGKSTQDQASPPAGSTNTDSGTTPSDDGNGSNGQNGEGQNETGGKTDSGSTDAGNGTGTGSTTGDSTGSAGSGSGTSGNGSATSGHQQQIKDIATLAKKGRVKGADFVSGKTTIEDVHNAWGEPDRPWQPTDRYAYDSYSPGAGRGSYAFGIGQGEVVYDIRYFGSGIDESTDLSKISFQEIENTLGKPSSVKTSGSDDVLTYKEGDYELKFVGPHATKRLDHISVYSPRAARSTMGGDATAQSGASESAASAQALRETAPISTQAQANAQTTAVPVEEAGNASAPSEQAVPGNSRVSASGPVQAAAPAGGRR